MTIHDVSVTENRYGQGRLRTAVTGTAAVFITEDHYTNRSQTDDRAFVREAFEKHDHLGASVSDISVRESYTMEAW